jgi:hypothetical protein
MLQYDPKKRSTAKELLASDLFKSVRNLKSEASAFSCNNSRFLREWYPRKDIDSKYEKQRVSGLEKWTLIIPTNPRVFLHGALLSDAIDKPDKLTIKNHVVLCVGLAAFFADFYNEQLEGFYEKHFEDITSYAAKINYDLINTIAYDILLERVGKMTKDYVRKLFYAAFDPIRFSKLPSEIVEDILEERYNPKPELFTDEVNDIVKYTTKITNFDI